jgi:hypothetical protein
MRKEDKNMTLTGTAQVEAKALRREYQKVWQGMMDANTDAEFSAAKIALERFYDVLAAADAEMRQTVLAK